VAYALNKERKVVDFWAGKRTISTLRQLTDRLLTSGVRKIKADRLTHYLRLTPKERHDRGPFGISHIERKNLTLRTHLKRLSRRTICLPEAVDAGKFLAEQELTKQLEINGRRLFLKYS
jgi:insertion element IS1 protein InsB